MDEDTKFVGIAVLVFCVLAAGRGVLATLTTIPLVGPALQVIGLVTVARWAWAKWRPQVSVERTLGTLGRAVSAMTSTPTPKK